MRAAGLDPVGAVAEVDRVQVVAEDPVLRPPARELVGERRLAQLLEDGALVLGGELDLHVLLRDGGRALDGAALGRVLEGGAQDAAHVDAGVRPEAAILDRDHRLLHHRGDLLLRQVDAPVIAGERPDLVAALVEQDRRLRRRVQRLELREVRGECHEQAERGRDHREDARGRTGR